MSIRKLLAICLLYGTVAHPYCNMKIPKGLPLVTLNIRCRIILGIQKETRNFTTTLLCFSSFNSNQSSATHASGSVAAEGRRWSTGLKFLGV